MKFFCNLVLYFLAIPSFSQISISENDLIKFIPNSVEINNIEESKDIFDANPTEPDLNLVDVSYKGLSMKLPARFVFQNSLEDDFYIFIEETNYVSQVILDCNNCNYEELPDVQSYFKEYLLYAIFDIGVKEFGKGNVGDISYLWVLDGNKEESIYSLSLFIESEKPNYYTFDLSSNNIDNLYTLIKEFKNYIATIKIIN